MWGELSGWVGVWVSGRIGGWEASGMGGSVGAWIGVGSVVILGEWSILSVDSGIGAVATHLPTGMKCQVLGRPTGMMLWQ